jgi:hypothetical protein
MCLTTGSCASVYVSTLPTSARRYLDQPVDRKTDLDLIADPMLHWEQKLLTHLGLTEFDVHDIKASLPMKPLLQRLIH